MRVVIVGYGEMLRALALGVLESNHELVGIFRHDFVKKNNIMRLLFDYVKPSDDYIFVKTHAINDIKAKSVNSDEFIKALKNLKADVVLVGSWSEKFSMQTINAIPNGFINVHPSLLPKYRGPNPYIHVILNDEKITGITFHLMDVGYDSGSILLQKELPILKNDTGKILRQRCCDKARTEIAFLLDNYKERVLNQRSQNEKEATYQSQISLKETVIDFEKETSEQISRRIRAFTPWFNCFLPIKNEFYSFKKYEITKESLKHKPGTIVDKTKNSIYITTKDNKVMKFTNLSICRPFSKFITQFFVDKYININDKAI